MMNTDPDDTVESGAITGDDPDGRHDDQDTASREGPAAVTPQHGGRHDLGCGTTAARALFMVFYRVSDGRVDLEQFESCCVEHEPPRFTILVDEAEVIQTDIADAYTQVVTTDRAALIYENPAPGHYIAPAKPWAWTMADNHPVRAAPFDPDVGFHATPRPAKAP
jgi:hypothetical protein